MDAYTLAIVGVLIFAIQALIAHSIFTLYVNEGNLRETIARQGAELIRLREEIESRHSEPESQPAGDTASIDQEETLEELIARYERDEAESWGPFDQSLPDESTARMRIN